MARETNEATAPAKARNPWLGGAQILVVAVLVVLALLYARAPGEQDLGPPPSAAGTGGAATLVYTIHPARTRTALAVSATGSVIARNHVPLTPQVGGRVVAIAPALRAGGAFAAGQELLVIDRRDFQLAHDQARADLASAEAGLELQQAESAAARANFTLVNPGVPVPPLVAKEPQIAQAKARVAAARARADIAALELDRTSFRLPFAGRVTASVAEVGQTLARGQSFGQAFALDAVEVVVPIAPDEVAQIAPPVGRAATVRVAGRAFQARVERQAAELDQRTRFATLYLAFADVGEAPSPGAFADVEIVGPVVEDAFLLPEAAEQTGGTIWRVEDGVLRQITPHTLGRLADGWLVAAFDVGDGVVVGAVPGAQPGLRVQAAPARED